MKRLVTWLTLGFIVVLYAAVLWRYDGVLPPLIPPEEVNLTNLAQNVAAGQGLVTTVASEFFPFPGRPQPFYMPVITYAIALSNWGTMWAFDPTVLRWFNRLLGGLNLVMLFVLARRWGISRRFALFASFWTALDIFFQMTNNVLRPDSFNLFWLLVGLWGFTRAEEGQGQRWWAFSGFCFALALFAHFWLAMYVIVWLTIVVLSRRALRSLVSFATPLAAAGAGWAAYAAMNWAHFRAIAQLVVHDKTNVPLSTTIFALLGLNDLRPFLNVYPTNAPIWLAPLIAITWARMRGQKFVKWWHVGLFWVVYFVGHGNLFPWYVGWFTPFGYLAVAWFGDHISSRLASPHVATASLAVALLWAGYQSVAIWRCWQAVPAIERSQAAFLEDLKQDLPFGAHVWLLTVPDASFSLQRERPDLNIYVGTGYFVPRFDFYERVEAMVFVESWQNKMVDTGFLPPYRIKRTWRLKAVLADYTVVWIEMDREEQQVYHTP